MKTKAKYKQRPLEKIQHQQVQERIANLEKALAESEQEKAFLSKRVESVTEVAEGYKKGWEEASADQSRYRFLRGLEVMVLDNDGAKYLKDDELTEYCDTQLKAFHEAIYGSFGKGFSATWLTKHNTQINNALRRVVAKEDSGVFLENISHPRSKK